MAYTSLTGKTQMILITIIASLLLIFGVIFSSFILSSKPEPEMELFAEGEITSKEIEGVGGFGSPDETYIFRINGTTDFQVSRNVYFKFNVGDYIYIYIIKGDNNYLYIKIEKESK